MRAHYKNFAPPSRSVYKTVLWCCLSIVAGQFVDIKSLTVLYTASVFVGPGTIANASGIDINIDIVKVIALFGTSSIFSKHPSFTC